MCGWCTEQTPTSLGRIHFARFCWRVGEHQTYSLICQVIIWLTVTQNLPFWKVLISKLLDSLFSILIHNVLAILLVVPIIRKYFKSFSFCAACYQLLLRVQFWGPWHCSSLSRKADTNLKKEDRIMRLLCGGIILTNLSKGCLTIKSSLASSLLAMLWILERDVMGATTRPWSFGWL